ncbi:protein-S-isoprenylcysteine O-methyltransferase Ste14 [Marmoricola sp. OAE513]|uniref:hypothetical protein n=1 Tax=Marmoricola sp. OAE513 TaxID=2817894 RepID=UPI001AE5392E
MTTFVGILWIALRVLTFVGLAYRVRVEEQALSAELGEAYAEYARTHRRLVPYLY